MNVTARTKSNLFHGFLVIFCANLAWWNPHLAASATGAALGVWISNSRFCEMVFQKVKVGLIAAAIKER